jgi:hypothetical protein
VVAQAEDGALAGVEKRHGVARPIGNVATADPPRPVGVLVV